MFKYLFNIYNLFLKHNIFFRKKVILALVKIYLLINFFTNNSLSFPLAPPPITNKGLLEAFKYLTIFKKETIVFTIYK